MGGTWELQAFGLPKKAERWLGTWVNSGDGDWSSVFDRGIRR